jgi:TPP-dependent pyruvate/acetoin dehydrogenase alpha subunit
MRRISHQSLLKDGPYRDLSLRNGDPSTAARLYRFMSRLRRCEEALAREYHPADEMRCPVHFCIGQEAVPAALSEVLTRDDFLFSHHRSHGYYLAKGAPMRAMFAELYGKETGANGGMAGSQDISYPSMNFFSGAILAGATAIAAGAADGIRLRKEPHVAVAGFGESATDEGLFWETVNYAGLRKLPIVFVCENNNYSVFSPQYKRQAGAGIAERVATFGVNSVALFGNDVIKVHAALDKAITDARAGGGPWFIEAYTYRWSGHYGPESDDLVGYRPAEELAAWKANCPIALLENALLAEGQLSNVDKAKLITLIDDEIDDAFRFAKSSAFPRASPAWGALNLSARSPLADRLLPDAHVDEFDENQVVVQAKGY